MRLLETGQADYSAEVTGVSWEPDALTALVRF
jgi:hypothetical protein